MDDTDIKFLRISKEPTVDEKKKSFQRIQYLNQFASKGNLNLATENESKYFRQ